jgi:RNA polymerase sigma-54 factor
MTAQLSTDLRLQQAQILSPQLQQSLKLLQTPSFELQTLLAQQLAVNPTLEEYDPTRDLDYYDAAAEFSPDAQDLADQREERSQSVAEESAELAGSANDHDDASEKKLDNIIHDDEDWRAHYSDNDDFDGRGRLESVHYHERRADDDEQYYFRLNSVASDRNLVDELYEQFGMQSLSPQEQEVVEYIVGSLDKNGFLRETPEEIAAATKADPAVAARLVNQLRSFEPAGIGARDLRECLLLQLERQHKTDTLAYRIISEYYHELLHNRRELVAHKLGVTIAEIQAAIDDIRLLDPKPGRDLSVATAPPIKPDVIVTRDENGGYMVETNDNLLPYVRINPRMRQMLKDKAVDKTTAQYLRRQMRDGETLINNLRFRKRTVLAVGEAIAAAQRDFLDEGPTHLRPLSMKEIAEKVGVHEATVSRTVNGKYMDTPQGVYEMRYFFNTHVTDDDGREVSTNAAKAKLRELIETEDKRNPHSDDRLAQLMRANGFPVARRTVVKYRQMLQIPNTRQRKEFA